jgi:diacylglycerol kinase family enzyme
MVVCDSDAAAREVFTTARRSQRPPPVVGLVGGDLWRTLGAPRGGRARLESSDAMRFEVDVGQVLVDGVLHWFVAHLVARRSWWRGRVVAAMNAEFLGTWTVAPRAHPGDGLLDIVDADPPLSDRWEARRRLPYGTHVPHPRISVRRIAAAQLDVAGLRVRLDGTNMGRADQLSLQVLDQALIVVI